MSLERNTKNTIIHLMFFYAISFCLPGNSELGIIIFRYLVFMRKMNFRGLSNLVLLIPESRGRSHGNLVTGAAVRAIPLNHIVFTHHYPILSPFFGLFSKLHLSPWILVPRS